MDNENTATVNQRACFRLKLAAQIDWRVLYGDTAVQRPNEELTRLELRMAETLARLGPLGSQTRDIVSLMREQNRLLGRAVSDRATTTTDDAQPSEGTQQFISISVGGIAFCAPSCKPALTPYQRLNLRFQLEGHPGQFHTSVKVLRTQSSASAGSESQFVAAQFWALDPWDERRLQRILYCEQKLGT